MTNTIYTDYKSPVSLPYPIVVDQPSVEEAPSLNQLLYLGGKKLLNKIEFVWNYASKGLSLTRSTLMTSVKTFSRLKPTEGSVGQKINNLVLKSKLLNVIGLPFALLNLIGKIEELIKVSKVEFYEGMALAAVTIVLLTVDILDSTNALVDTLVSLEVLPTQIINEVVSKLLELASLENFGAMLSKALPFIGFGTLGVSSVMRIMQLIKTKSLYNKLKACQKDNYQTRDFAQLETLLNQLLHASEEEKKQVKGIRTLLFKAKNSSQFKSMENSLKKIKSKLGRKPIPSLIQEPKLEDIKEEIAEARKKLALNYAASSKLATQLQELENNLKKEGFSELEAPEALEKIIHGLEKKMAIEWLNLVVNALTCIGLILFLLPVPPVAPFIFLSLGIVLKIGIMVYQEKETTEFDNKVRKIFNFAIDGIKTLFPFENLARASI